MKTDAKIKHCETPPPKKIPKTATELISCWPSTVCCWAWGPPFSVVNLSCETPLRKTDSFQAVVSWKWLGWKTEFSSPLSPGTLSDLNLCRPRACHHSLCEVIWASVLLCLEDAASPASSVPVGSYNLLASSASILSHSYDSSSHLGRLSSRSMLLT